jgi:hypothetical protein
LDSFGTNVKHEVLRNVPPQEVVALLKAWRPGGDSLPWAGARFTEYLQRRIDAGLLDDFTLVRLGHPDGGPRSRRWSAIDVGMAALLQGSDARTGYPGDGNLLLASTPQLQIHRVRPTGAVTGIAEILTLALYIPTVKGYPDHLVFGRV